MDNSKSTWKIDAAHSEVQFKVKHMMIATVTGDFRKFDATIVAAKNDFSDAEISFTAQTDSVSTGSADRDKHLASADFFDAENHPEIKFESTNVENGKVNGTLTIKGTSKPVTLNLDFGGTGKDPYGNLKAGFTISGKINRKDWGLNWNAALEAGGVLVSDEVRILCEVQFAKA